MNTELQKFIIEVFFNNSGLFAKEFSQENLNKEMELLISKMKEYIYSYNSENSIKMCDYILKRVLAKNKNVIIPKLPYNIKKYKFDSTDASKYIKLTK